ncbi:MAG: Imm74 family immunity protein [Acidobacteriota bacterium]|nr:Imm74 family immunity protein [Acidobacteriota bacterium]
MFRRTWKGAISDAGFEVKIRRPHDIEYREGGRLLMAYMEMLSGEHQIYLDSRSIRAWNPPFQNELIAVEKKQKILSNICAALDFLGLKYVIR